jgi:hypothetical protein
LRPLTEQELRWKADNMLLYQALAQRSAATLRETEALTAVEPGRRRIDIPEAVPFPSSRQPTMTYQFISVQKRGRVGLVTLNRPKAAQRAQSRISWRARPGAQDLRRR